MEDIRISTLLLIVLFALLIVVFALIYKRKRKQ